MMRGQTRCKLRRVSSLRGDTHARCATHAGIFGLTRMCHSPESVETTARRLFEAQVRASFFAQLGQRPLARNSCSI